MENNIIELLNKLTSRTLIDVIDDPIFLKIKNEHPDEWAKLKMAYCSELERMRNIYMEAYCNAINDNNRLKEKYELKTEELTKEIEEVKNNLLEIEKERNELKIRLEYSITNKSGNGKLQGLQYIFIGVGALMILGFILTITDKESYKITMDGLGVILRAIKDVIVETSKLN